MRSWQINEGVISREDALFKVLNDNQPSTLRIKEYLDLVGLDYEDTMNTINNIQSNVVWKD